MSKDNLNSVKGETKMCLKTVQVSYQSVHCWHSVCSTSFVRQSGCDHC